MSSLPVPPASLPYWWEDAPLVTPPEQALPAEADVVVIGAGYTGLAAAIELAGAGRSVVVLERGVPGEGASSRNGGMASGNIRPSQSDLARTFGSDRAAGITREGKEAREDLAAFLAAEGIDCDYLLTGHFKGAASRAAYDQMGARADQLSRDLGIEAYVVPKSEQHGWLGTDFYHGGLVRKDIAGLHPAKLHAGLMRVALARGAQVHGETPALTIARRGSGHLVTTPRGAVTAGEVVVCVNGYADGVDPWLRRRLIPIRSRIVATDPLAPGVMDRLMPKRAMCGDTRELSYYYRPSPDGTRILFGGRDRSVNLDEDGATRHLRDEIVRLFPELSGIGLTHSWFGHVAMHRDMVPRVFRHEGRVYACGFCGSGVVWARWAGKKAALQLLGRPEGATAFDFRPPKSIPFYNGTPWFMPAIVGWMAWKDARAMKAR